MAAPINTYNSATNLNLGQVPTLDDPALYSDLLDIHNALEILLTSSDTGGAAFIEFLAKYRDITQVSTDYLVLAADGTVLVKATTSSVVVTLPVIASILGYRFEIKNISSGAINKVTLVGNGTELIDSHTGGIRISKGSSYTVKATTTGWVII